MADGPLQTPDTAKGIRISGLRDLFTWAGFTKPAPRMEDVQPRVDQEPLGASGRAHFNGFIQFDEMLQRLVGIEGLRIYDQMYRSDPHVRRNILAVWSPIQGATWEVTPHGEDDATPADIFAAELCEWVLWSYMRPNFTEHLATVGPLLLRSGYLPFEQIWASTEFRGKKIIAPRKLDLRLPRTIWKWYQDEYGELSAVEQLLPNAASVEIPASELVYYRLASEGDNWTGTSLLRQAYKPWFYKEHMERIDAIGQERKAVGVPIVYPPQGTDTVTRGEVETVLANLHVNQAGYLLMPGPKAGAGVDPGVGWTVEIVTFDSSSGQSVKDSIEYQQRAISSSVLADFMELGHHEVGARATASVQDDPFLSAVGALGNLIAIPLNELLARIAELNVPGITGPPTLKLAMHDDASLSELATFVGELVKDGIMVADPELEDYLRERADLPPANPEIRKQHEEAQAAARAAAAQMEPGGEGGEDQHERETGEGPGGKPKQPQPGGGGPKKGDPDAQGGHTGGDPSESKNGPQKRQLEAPAPPPNLREASTVEDVSGNVHRCGTCRMFNQGECWGYGNLPVRPVWVCDSWTLAAQRVQLDAEPAPPAPAITGPWYERLLSQGKLKEALDGARDGLQRAATPAAYNDAQTIVAHAVMGGQHSRTPSDELVNAIQGELERLHQVGYDTAQDEIAKQHAILGTRATHQLADDPKAGRLGKARDRAKLAAQNVVNEIYSRVQRAAIGAIKKGPALERTAREAADGALRVEALANASAQINEGRAAAAAANQPDVVGGIYTSVLDGNTCDQCAATDTGDIQEPGELELLGPPNPNCAGADRCRCMIVWVLTEDPRALAAGLGELVEG